MQNINSNIASQIIYEDNHLLVINKKVGQLVQGDKTGDESLLDSIKNFIKIRDNKPGNVFLGLVHNDYPSICLKQTELSKSHLIKFHYRMVKMAN